MIEDCFCQILHFFERKHNNMLEYYMYPNGTLNEIDNSTMVHRNHLGITIFSVKFYAIYVQNHT